ncbi:ankyrin repeat domain-containing protein [Marinobacter xestospongiae]|nr:ankyrin repeat domain-containing protein [Marinobacter xestospongiae]
MELNYEMGHRYGERESLDQAEALSKLDALIEELFDEFHSEPDDEHRQVYVLEGSGSSLTAFVDGYTVLEYQEAGSIATLYRTIESEKALKKDFVDFILTGLKVLEDRDWVSEKAKLELISPSIFRSKGDGSGYPLHEAAYRGDLGRVKQLVSLGCDVDLQDSDGATPIMHAIVEGNYDVVKYLVDHGADLSIKDDDGCDVFELSECFREIGILLKGKVRH